ncbi:hypothetical protein EVAR_29740_1 [Eumeta japonica]|uniref:Uncharacterized protein n=1 Tax=Eumeta variegata TaxID=151549 RepID=A0A4C1VXL4_EUMVA|nr:hypothetical protein EVAR_29740_1 [Eumeta japonica]
MVSDRAAGNIKRRTAPRAARRLNRPGGRRARAGRGPPPPARHKTPSLRPPADIFHVGRKPPTHLCAGDHLCKFNADTARLKFIFVCIYNSAFLTDPR